jgi:hypothetical protein
MAAFAAVAAIYFAAPGAYVAFMTALIKVPVEALFADWVWLSSSVECWQRGVNVYADNPCFLWPSNAIYSNAFNYSPLWLRLSFIPAGLNPAMATAVVLDLAFFLSLAWLRPPGDRAELVVMALALLSSSTALALERANADVLMFILVIAGAAAASRALPLRLAGYGLILAAGLLKFYPLAALALAVRERTAVFLVTALVSAAAFAGFVLAYKSELALAAHNLPWSSLFTLRFGATDLPGGLAVFATKALAHARHVNPLDLADLRAGVQLGLKATLTVLAGAAAFWGAKRFALAAALRGVAERDAMFMVAGAAVLCGCFFTGQSVIYRAIFWLLVLPAWLGLARAHPLAAGRRGFRAACGLVLFVLWMPAFEWLLGEAGLARPPRNNVPNPFDNVPDLPLGALLWMAGELTWWILIAALAATAAAYLLDVSPLASRLRLFRRTRPAAT